MENTLKNFDEMEKTYQNIKKVTGIEDVEEIEEKFINKEQRYGDLLTKIAIDE